MNLYLYLSILAFVASSSLSFDDNLENSPAVKKKYEELVAVYMEQEDKSCRKAALQEAKLTLGGDVSSGEEQERSEPRLSKPKGTH